MNIFFLGHPLDRTDVPVIKVGRKNHDVSNNEEIIVRDKFIESLPHGSFLVQIPSLTGKRRTELETLLGIFDQNNISYDNYLLYYKEEEQLPEKYRPILRRLSTAACDRIVRSTMREERLSIKDFKELEREVMENREIIEQKTKLAEQHDKAVKEKNMANEGRQKLIEELGSPLKNRPE